MGADASTDSPAEGLVVGFASAARLAGLAVPTGSTLAFAEALSRVGVARRSSVYWAGRATLVRNPGDIATYDRVFDAFWAGFGVQASTTSVREILVAHDGDDAEDGADAQVRPDDRQAPRSALQVRYSAWETLGEKDFAAYTDDEWSEAQRLLVALRFAAELRRSRRRRPTHHRHAHPDLRATLRRAMRTGGEPMHLAYRRQTQRPRRVVLLLDVSGSMEPYARALLRFAHVALRARGAARTEVFTIGTRLTRLTRELSEPDPDAALGRAAIAVADWSGGTRLGEGLAQFNDRWGIRGAARGAVVAVLSDGWDRGDPAELAEQMARLGRVAHRVVWVNPLKASPGYAPLARGMAAALPYVDQFVDGHSLNALGSLAAVLSSAR
ncbi:MAG: vWA domain-containing protein [Acidimicrobiales bacterium]|uniref:VWFA domain-containing protein n=1 Tax=Candidatus Aeolococcus gillhamiae TaxID=3127015 RepID=A0A2W6A2B4_9BACT|nr:MAG: hypothetical protein DLM65_10410 [Candidatus Dormibacter sp. RRmetagenome_bin12]